MRSRKGFRKINADTCISSELFFFKICYLITSTVCANKFSYHAYLNLVCTHRRSYKTTSFEKKVHCLKIFFWKEAQIQMHILEQQHEIYFALPLEQL